MKLLFDFSLANVAVVMPCYRAADTIEEVVRETILVA